jgi:hypothetical protein
MGARFFVCNQILPHGPTPHFHKCAYVVWPDEREANMERGFPSRTANAK